MAKEGKTSRRGGAKPGERRGGRQPGTPNKATAQAREAIAAFVEGNVDRLNGWLDAIAADSPKDAFDRLMSVVEYHIPKLQRQEMTGLNGDAIKTHATVEFVNAEEAYKELLK